MWGTAFAASMIAASTCFWLALTASGRGAFSFLSSKNSPSVLALETLAGFLKSLSLISGKLTWGGGGEWRGEGEREGKGKEGGGKRTERERVERRKRKEVEKNPKTTLSKRFHK